MPCSGRLFRSNILRYGLAERGRAAPPQSTKTSGRTSMRMIGHVIGGKAVEGESGRFGDVFNPNTGEVQAKVAFAKRSEVEHAIAIAAAAQPDWAATNPQRRAR